MPPNYSWSPDGQRVAYAAVRGGLSNLFTVGVDGAAETPLTSNAESGLAFYCPRWSPDGRQFVFLGQRRGAASRESLVYLFDGAQAHVLWQTAGQVRLLGWAASGAAFYVATTDAARTVDPLTARLLRLPTAPAAQGQAPVEITQFNSAYWQTFTLDPAGKQLAYVARQEHAANLWLATLATGERRRLTTNHEPSLTLGCVTWAPQGQQLGFTKQSNTTSILMIENFK
jgi:Tol biopolymer transport system component